MAQAGSQGHNQADTTQKQEVQLIRATEITNRLPKSTTRLQEIRSELISDEGLASLKADADSFLLDFARFLESESPLDTATTDPRLLENDLYQWSQWRQPLESIKGKMTSVVEELDAQKDEVDQMAELWKLSMEKYTDEAVPPSVMKTLDEFIAYTEETSTTINDKIRTIFTVLDEISIVEIKISEWIRIITQELEGIAAITMLEKSPWLIRLILSPEDSNYFVGNISENIRLNLLPTWSYVLKHKNTFFLLALMFVVFGNLLWIFKKEFRIKESRLTHLVVYRIDYIIRKPILTALYITLVLAIFILPQPPQSFRQIVFLTLLVPIMLLLPGLLQHKLDRFIVYLVILVLILDVSDLILHPFILDKFIEIIAAALLFYGTFYILRDRQLAGIFDKKGTEYIITFFSAIALLLLGISIIGNIIGYYFLGEFLVESVTWSYYSIALFIVGYVILTGLLYAIIHSKPMMKTSVIQKYSIRITQWFFNITFAAATLFWFYLVMFIFRINKEFLDVLSSIWSLGFTVGTFSFSLGSAIAFIITLWIAVLLSRVIQTVLEEDVLPKFQMSRGVPKTIAVMVKYGMITIGVLIAFAAAGIELSSLAILLGALGVGIGFGLQDVINNFISGLILLFERPVRVGDAVRVGDLEGIVMRIGLRSSILQTFDRSEVIVPNGHLISREVINWTLSNTLRRLEIEVGVAYGSDFEKVMKILKECAESHELVMSDPAPYVWFKGYGDSSVNFRLLFFYPQFEGGLSLRSEIAKAIDKAFRENGITIPFPQRDLYIKEHALNELKPPKK
jgi:small-conductance mechanosensitive channel